MDAATRSRMLSGTSQADVTSGNACWQTPPAVFNKLHDEFGFDIDLFAAADTTLMPIWFGPGSEFAEDAMTVPWMDYGSVGFSNPPYGAFLAGVLRAAVNEAKANGFVSVHLLPLRLTKIMRDVIFRSEALEQWLIPDKRITFFENGAPRLDAKGTPMPAMFDSTILVIGPYGKRVPRVGEWHVPDHVPAEFKRKAA